MIACWTLPSEEGFKLNYDGTSKGNPGLLGFGCVVRDCKGNDIWLFIALRVCVTPLK